MRTRFTPIYCLMAGAVLLALAGGSALAATSSNYWNSTSSGNFTNDPSWNVFPAGNFAPTNSSAFVWFTNRVASGSAYTVALTKSVSTGPLNVSEDSVTFDLGGFRWDTPVAAGNLGTNATPVNFFTVKFSSSSTNLVANGNVFNWGAFSASVGLTTATDTKLVIDDSLGHPILFDYSGGLSYMNGDVVVSGTNSELHIDFPNSNLGTVHGNTLVTNKAVLSFGAGNQNRPIFGTATFYNSLLSNTSPNTALTLIGFNAANSGTVILSNNSTWLDGTLVDVGGTGPGSGTVIMDNGSTFKGNKMQISDAAGNAASTLKILGGSSATFTNGLWVTKQNTTATNQFTLNNSTINLGVGATRGYLTNSAKWFASGTISGQGTSHAIVYNNGQLVIGNPINPVTNITVSTVTTNVFTSTPGKLTVLNADVVLDTSSSNYFQFSDTAVSQLVASNGFVRLLGTNIFALANGSATPVHGVKFGLGVYDFVEGTSVSNAPQYDNLVRLLTNKYNLVYGVDFQYGVVNLGNGLFALELAFVPEPSTVLLLALGGLMIWRRIAKRRKSGKTVGILLAGALILTLAGSHALAAVSTNYWNSTSSGNFTNDANWNVAPAGNFAPTNTSAVVFFTNRVASGSAYTVKLTKSVSTGPLNVMEDSVTFDLGGYRWDTPIAAGNMGTNPVATAFTVKFSSSSATNVSGSLISGTLGNVFNWGGFSASVGLTVATDTKLVVDDSLGFPVTVVYAGGLSLINGDVLVSGTNSQLMLYFPNSNLGALTGKTIVTNKAVLSWGGVSGQPRPLYGTAVFYNSMYSNTESSTANTMIGTITPGTLILSNNSTWLDGTHVVLGDTTNPGRGDVLADNSTIKGNYIQLGASAASLADSLKIINGSSATFTNGIWIAKWNAANTNQFVLNNSTINLGVGATRGYLTNSAKWFASGTISGQGTSHAIIYNNGQLVIGNPINPVTNITVSTVTTNIFTSTPGKLTVLNADVVLDTSSSNYFQFSDTAVSQLVASNGFVRLLGTNIFALANGSATPVHGVKFGLGVYDFVEGTSISNAPQRDNLVFLLTNKYNLVYGVDFQYGVVNLGNGLFALELAFVPEPSTVLLLALGGLMAWRRVAKRRTK